MSIALASRMIYKTEDNIQLGLYLKGDEFLHWFEDTTGNPIVMDKGKPRYADWSPETMSFVPSEYVTKESRRRHLKRLRRRPTHTEAVEVRKRVEDGYAHIDGAPAKMEETEEDSLSEYSLSARSSPPGLSKVGIAAGVVKRPILLIYVRFADSTGTSVPDSYLTEITFDKTKFGTLAHYFHTQFNGSVELVNLGVYHVTLPTNGKVFGTGNLTRSDIWIPVLEDLFTNQGVDFRTFGTTHPDTYGYAPNRIDRSSCTPIIILHGQEESFGVAGSCSVWGHAYRDGTGIVIKNDGHPDITLGGNAFHLKNAAMFGAFHGSDYFNLGIYAHECGHALFDLPDLYDTDKGTGKDRISGFGAWSLMSYNWLFTAAEPRAGSTPSNLDGYSIWRFNKKLAKAITNSGPQVLNNPFEPHVIRMPGVNSEAFIVQSRAMTGYDEGAAHFIWLTVGGTISPGVLIMHHNPGSTAEANRNANDMVAMVVEAHGGTQNLREDMLTSSKSNDGDAGDLFGPTKTAFGDSVSDPDNILLYEEAGRKGLFDMTAIVGNTDGTGSYNIVFPQQAGTDPDWGSLPDDPEAPEQGSSGSGGDDDDYDDPDTETFDWDDPFRHAVRDGTALGASFQVVSVHGVSGASALDAGSGSGSDIRIALHRPCPYPFSIIPIYPVAGAVTNVKTGALTVATEHHVLTARLISHRLISYYKNRQIGEGTDIYVGTVISGKSKTVKVEFRNEDKAGIQMHDICIELVPSSIYPYYDYADLSLDGVTWSKSILYSASQLLSTESGAALGLCTFTFYARVSLTTTVIEPKPIRVRTTYTRVLP